MLVVNTVQIAEKQTKTSAGVAVVTLKKNQSITDICKLESVGLTNESRYQVQNLPATGALLREKDLQRQITMEL